MFDREVEKVLADHEKRIKELEKKHEFITPKRLKELVTEEEKEFSKEDIKVKEESEKQTKESGRMKTPAYTREPPIEEKEVENEDNNSKN